MIKFLKIIVFVVLLLIIYLSLNPLVLDYSDSSINLTDNRFKKGDEFTLNDLLNQVDKSHYKVYLILNEEDDNIINSEKIKNTVLVTSDKNLILRLFNEKFIYTDKDVSTIQSKMVLCSGEKVVFKSAILISNEKIGIQNRYTGWSELKESKDFNSILKQFKEYYFPILILK
ncbi:hypothetical protein NHF50_08005 [Flavobacterium sp. NRK F10]|uniref:hypothetical protein n=1 Tax=Flavobacterium sp. NRK F10 TaxID=2954931 RepID=UPI0020902FB2|nr:hypothetical protein [Flavobacterium sp. NRK F10]MCO6174988.1 hypothetical protein [Flavobacterium sp. NRK F10]